ncbi:TolC family protein [Trichloromonas sp.]|uniref:TolC family protein n=1 Tax=Trichloromonas sp. TaxID=3069249 RepID=UPI003D8160CB
MPRMLFICVWALCLFALNPQAHAEMSSATEVGTPLSLDRALALALAHNPEVDATAAEIRAYEADALQAGLRPNPVLDLELENLAGSGEFSGTDATEATLMLSQAIELGGKREHRRRAAEAETALAQSRSEITRTELRARTTRQFIAVLSAQQRLQLADDLVTLARRALSTVEERIEAGKAPATEKLRARILVAELEIARTRETHTLAAERQSLAALLGGQLKVAAVAGELTRLPHLPPLTELEPLLEQSPQLAQWDAQRQQRERTLALTESRRIPDLEVGVGIRYFNDSEDNALVAGLSIPLPLFDRNQGAVAAARSRADQVRAEQRNATLQARAALTTAWQQMNAAHEEAEALRDQVLPAAEEALAAAEYGYRAGKFPLLDVLDAQRTLIEMRQGHLAALAGFHQAVAELERLLGRPLPGLAFNSNETKENTPS